MRTAVLLVAVFLSGCATTEAWRRTAQLETAALFGGTPDAVTVQQDPKTGAFSTELDGRRAVCLVDPPRYREIVPTRMTCRETSRSSEEATQRVVIDRLALETGCPATEIRIDQATEWSRGTERAYRMTACAKSYVCTTAPGRTDCEPALVSDAKP